VKTNLQRFVEQYRSIYQRWGNLETILAGLTLVAILSLGSGFFGRWIIAARQAGLIPVSLHSIMNADYSVDEWLAAIPVITLDILRDLFGLAHPNIPSQGTLPPFGDTPTSTSPAAISPSPTMSPSGTPGKTPTLTYTISPTTTPSPTATSGVTFLPPTSTATSRPPENSTETPAPTPPAPSNTPATATVYPTLTSTTTVLPPPLTDTPEPTDAPVITATPTEPGMTNTPVPPTPVPPSATPTPRPTHAPTLDLTPTEKYTPAPTY
jgi:hypothetical protein